MLLHLTTLTSGAIIARGCPPTPRPPIFSSLIPPSASASAHFPFGHVIGSEELLIIALMLTVYLAEGESADSELLLLLGLLLFAG